ncbi:type II toxin-antitoxin system VapC family toxin [Gemmatimonas sp.]|uniref:type II toxin-antitoxin system VapC family toxin n=1 Tax=Gemmatimonas sp. TaxID=1962908 RepID=UPI003983230F
MRVLLDTHVWIWLMLEPARLRRSTYERLSNPETVIHLSPISVWEAVLLVERGRLRVVGSARRWVESALAATPHRDAPLTTAVAMSSREISVPYNDPADRFLAATAAVFDLTLVTADQNLLQGSGYHVLPAA